MQMLNSQTGCGRLQQVTTRIPVIGTHDVAVQAVRVRSHNHKSLQSMCNKHIMPMF